MDAAESSVVMGVGAVGQDRGVAFPIMVRFLARGTGRSVVTGGMGKTCREAIQVTLVWADHNLDGASRRLSPRTPENQAAVLRVFEPDLDVVVILPPVLQLPKNGTSIGAAVAAARCWRLCGPWV